MKKSILILVAATILNSKLGTLNCQAQLISGGAHHSLALCGDGTVQSWGEDSNGQLGNDALFVNKPLPVSVTSLTNVIAISAGGGMTSFALRSDSTVWAWGWDAYGQAGDDTAHIDRALPVQVANLSSVISISAGHYHSHALKNDGTVWSWGYDKDGRLGDDTAIADKTIPVQIPALAGIVAISGGGHHSLSLKNDNTVLAWGDDNDGQLGNDTARLDQPTPVQVVNLTNVIAVSAGAEFSLALKSDSTVWAWGDDAFGQLGDDVALADKSLPVQVSGLTGIVAIYGAARHALALKSDGTVWSWGEDIRGQLGDGGSNINMSTPVKVVNLTNVVAISGGTHQSLALKNDGTLWSWGWDGDGQLGNDTPLVNQSAPVQVNGLCNLFTSLEPEQDIKTTVSVYPNPSNGNFSIELATNFSGTVEIEIYNSLGQKTYATANETLNQKTISIEDLNLKEGVYFLRIICGKEMYQSKIVIRG